MILPKWLSPDIFLFVCFFTFGQSWLLPFALCICQSIGPLAVGSSYGKREVEGENCRPFTDDRKRINWYYSLELKNSQFLDLYATAGRCFSRISEPFLSLSREKSVSKWEELRKMDTKRLLLSHFFVSAVNCNYFPLDFLSQWGGDKGELCYALKPKYSSRGFYCS